nr:integrase, catalytic region, zinc finger, CCHC-type, peptidase aspartic, catalytic [Tanacetum cinerariifolium]
VDLLTGSRGNNLYTLSLQDMMASSPIYLLSKASKTKSWLWHCRLSHLNFSAINHLARQGLVRGLPKLKFKKDHLCSACAMGKSTKKSHKPKFENTNQEKLYLLHMDLCGLMRIESVNGKKYILVIVDDYSRFTWVKFLRSKDEALDFIIKFLKMIQVRLKVPVRQAMATACYTQNRSIIRLRHGKTPYELLHKRLADIASPDSRRDSRGVPYEFWTVGCWWKSLPMVNTRTDADLSAAVQNALQTLLPQIRAEIREEFRTSSGPLNAGGNPPPVTIHTWLERFNKQKPYSLEKATAPVDAEN